MKINENYNNLYDGYIFAEIGKNVREIERSGFKVLNLGIGDATLPIFKGAAEAMTRASTELSNKESFRGYSDAFGYDFLRSSVKEYYENRNVSIPEDDIFITCGAKESLYSLFSLFSTSSSVMLPDPGYPAVSDMATILGMKTIFLPAKKENSFLPMPDDKKKADIIYICSPSNPVGSAYSASELKEWVDFAIKENSVIIYDAAYEAFSKKARSIFEVDNAKYCSIEVCSLSKTAGFTGIRCGWTIVPSELSQIKKNYCRYLSGITNGISYITQRGAEASLSKEGTAYSEKLIGIYEGRVKKIKKHLDEKSIEYVDSDSSPYVFAKIPDSTLSYDFAKRLLFDKHIAVTPGRAFGRYGEGYFRISGFGEI